MDEDGRDSDFCRYESECCRLILPFLRVASLIRHYVFQQDLPDVTSELSEFEKLSTFLELKQVDRIAPVTTRDDNDMDDSTMSPSIASPRFVSTLAALNWFTNDSSEMLLWLESLKSSVSSLNLAIIRKALKISLVWKQPKLLRLPKNYDQIFQVYFSPLLVVNLCTVQFRLQKYFTNF
jgi:hypothetical protein